MKQIIGVLQTILVWTKFAQGMIEMVPVDAGWKADVTKLINTITNEITKFIETHPVEASTIAKGYAATVAFCNSVLSRIDLIVVSTAPKDQRLKDARSLADDLSDPNKVYQAQKGDDAAALKGAKAAAARRIETIENQA